MTAIKAHFDGKVLVPDEPLDLPVGEPLQIHIKRRPLARLAELLGKMPDDATTPSELAAQHDHYLHDMPKKL